MFIKRLFILASLVGAMSICKISYAADTENIKSVIYTHKEEDVWATCNVNIRENYYTESESIGLLCGGDSIARLGTTSNGWSLVEYNGKRVFIYNDYLTIEEPNYHYSDTYIGTFKISTYCVGTCCNGKWAGTTSTGVKPTVGTTIAVDPSVIKYGTTVYIEGIGYRTAQDCGGGVKGNEIDLLVGSHAETLNWNNPRLDVWVIK